MAQQKATLKAKSPRRKTTKPAKKKPVVIENRPFPKWLRLVIALFIVVLILSISYLLFIRPYAYRWKPCYGLKAYDVCIPCCYEVHGIDVSHHQGTIDWLQIVESKNTSFPIEFVFMKATEGGDHLDTTYFKNFENAGKSNIIRGVYHFFSPYTDPHKQADFFIKTVELSKGDLPPVLDIEVIGRASKGDLVNNAKVWLSRVEKHYGVKPIIYTSYNFKNKYLDDLFFDDYPYWIAHYYVDTVKYNGKWHFWQHSDVGIVPGIKNDVDLNVYNGTLEELKQLTIK